MARMMATVVLAWWFAVTYPDHIIGRVVGPFHSRESCDYHRVSFKYTTTCWWDGKP